jgi:predicted transcriptional regulator
MIPVGEENAVTARLLWKQLDWSFASIKHKLNEMAVAGLIQRKRVMREARLTSLYYRPRGGAES